MVQAGDCEVSVKPAERSDQSRECAKWEYWGRFVRGRL